MTRNELDKRFTAKVGEYIAKGYTINLDTMGGSGHLEVGKVDMRKGGEVIRILMLSEHAGLADKVVRTLRVGRCTDTLRGDATDFISNERLEVLEEEAWLVADEGKESERLAPIGSASELSELCWERLKRNVSDGKYRRLTGDKAKAIALKYVRRQPRMRNAQLADIEQVMKTPDGYQISARGKTFILR